MDIPEPAVPVLRVKIARDPLPFRLRALPRVLGVNGIARGLDIESGGVRGG